jgi:hypothetical protein
MPLTPQITLTATLTDMQNVAIGTAANPAKLRIALCGFGPAIPQVAGVGTIAQIQEDVYFIGTALTIKLWGNDVIAPAHTYYTITVFDGAGNVVQCGAYQFTGTQTVDLSQANQILPGPPQGMILGYRPCTGAVPGTAYTAPGPLVALFYNGVALPVGMSLPTLSYTLTGGTQINLNFTTQTGDRIDALCLA